jgi:hypothetical protein
VAAIEAEMMETEAYQKSLLFHKTELTLVKNKTQMSFGEEAAKIMELLSSLE